MIQPLKYRGYTITHDPPPIPFKSFAWQFVHQDYDGAPDSHDGRCGSGFSDEDCRDQIDEIELDRARLRPIEPLPNCVTHHRACDCQQYVLSKGLRWIASDIITAIRKREEDAPCLADEHLAMALAMSAHLQTFFRPDNE